MLRGVPFSVLLGLWAVSGLGLQLLAAMRGNRAHFVALWITVVGIGFVLELVALISGVPGATLSANVWSLQGTGIYSLILFFLGWLIYHFTFEGGS